MKNALFSNLRILGNNRKRCQCPGYFPSEILGGERVKDVKTSFIKLSSNPDSCQTKSREIELLIMGGGIKTSNTRRGGT